MATCAVVHELPGRLRLRAPGLRGNSALATSLQEAIEAQVPICKASADPRSGRILVIWPTQAGRGQGVASMAALVVQVADEVLGCGGQDGSSALMPDISAQTETETHRAPLASRPMPKMQGSQRLSAPPPLPDLARGLSEFHAVQLLVEYGTNTLPEPARVAWWKIVLQQFRDPMTLAFCTVATLSFVTRRLYDGVAMLAVIGVNAMVSVTQETRLAQEAKGIKALQTPVAVVVRDGIERTIPATGVVPGDVLILTAGDRVPADGVVTLSSHLEVDESCLTGESAPVQKMPPASGVDAWVLPRAGALQLGEHVVFFGTLVTRGRARVLVRATGARTEMGRIAHSLSQSDPLLTPLQMRLRTLGRWLVTGIVLTVGAVVAVGLLRGFPASSMWMTGLTLAASAIPEGLPVLITIGLTSGVRRLAKRKALISRLSALETLGRTTVICSDKTGTLTMNEMTVRYVYCGDRLWEVTGDGYETKGRISTRDHGRGSFADVAQLARYAVLCSDASLASAADLPTDGRHAISGDPGEAALLAFAHKAGLHPEQERQGVIRRRETPFSSELRRMSVLCQERAGDKRAVLIVKGAVEEVIARCSHHLVDGEALALTQEASVRIVAQATNLASRALRVLAVAHCVHPSLLPLLDASDSSLEVPERCLQDLVFTGLVAMMDPPRPLVKESLARCKKGGIRVVMITGDHPDTALAIARHIDLVPAHAKEDAVMLTGAQIDRLTSAELIARAGHVVLYARVSPHHKLAIVRALQAAGNVVAMTGDGVNDAPAIKKADVGIAMGKSGTEVAKEASALTLADDNFVTIIEAVREGRDVLGNIRRAVGYLLSGNIGEVLFAALAVLLGLPLPLAPVQILLVNLLTDAAPTLALLTQSGPPTHPDAELLPLHDLTDRPYLRRILSRGVVIALSALGVFAAGLRLYGSPLIARTMAMVSLIGAQLLQIGIWHRDGENRDRISLSQGTPLRMTGLISGLGLLATIYVPPLQKMAQTEFLPMPALFIAVSGALVLPALRWLHSQSHGKEDLGVV